MPRKLILNWDKNNKVWYKRIDGKKVYFGAGRWKHRDKPAYDAAVAKYNAYLQEHGVVMSKPKPKKTSVTATSRSRFKRNTLEWAIDEYLRYETARYNLKQITNKRLALIAYVMKFFAGWLGKENLTREDGLKEINSQKYNYWYKHLEKRVTGEAKRYSHIKWRTANSYFQVVKGFFMWLYIERELIDTIPRNFHYKKFKQPKHSVFTESKSLGRVIYEQAEVQALLDKANDKYPMRLWILLALNCGLTAIDISTLTEEHLQYNDDGDVYGIEKPRKKTGVFGEWILWESTKKELLLWLDKRNNDDVWKTKFNDTSLIFLNKSGAPLTSQIMNSSGLDAKAGSTQTIQYHFRMLREKTYEKGDDVSWMKFKNFRKTGATWINHLDKPNSDIIEMLYLAHKPSRLSRSRYVFVDKHLLTQALKELETKIPLEV